MYRYSDLQKLKKRLDENVNSKSFTKKRLLDYLVECGVCSKESFVYITPIIFAWRKQYYEKGLLCRMADNSVGIWQVMCHSCEMELH